MSMINSKGQAIAQRSASLNKNSDNIKINKKQQIEERRIDIKRKLFEQMQIDLRNHPEGQAKSYETIDNAKKLKKMLVKKNEQNNKVQQKLQNQQINNKQNAKQRSQSIQQEYKKGQYPYNNLNCTPQQTQIKSSSTSYIQQNKQEDIQHQEQLDSNERITFHQKNKELFKDQTSQQYNGQKSFQNNDLGSHQKKSSNLDKKIKCNNASFQDQISSNKILKNKEYVQNKEISQNQQKQDNFNRKEYEQNKELNNQSNMDIETNIFHQISQENPSNLKNSPQHKQETNNSLQKKSRSYSASTSCKKQGYSNLIQNEQEKQEIFKKIQDQKDQISESNKQYKVSSNNQNKVCNGKNLILNKPTSTQNNKQQQNNILNQIQLNTPQTRNLKQDESNLQIKSTIQKQRSVSTYQQSNTSTSKGNFNVRQSNKDQYEDSSEQEINNNRCRELDKSFDEKIIQKEQKINDMQRIIERMKIENNQKLSRLEIKKLEEQLEKDKLCEKQMLDLKVQQKAILILQQEKDLLQEESDSYENKYKSLLTKSKHFEKIRLGLEDEIQRQVLVSHESKSQIGECKVLNNDLNKRFNILKKQYRELEDEKEKINLQKQKIQDETSSQITQYKSLNQTNIDLTIEFERQNKENQYQIGQLIQRVNDITKKYSESQKNYAIFEKKFKAEQIQKDQFRVELKLIQADVQENQELKKKIIQQDNKLEELEIVVDDLKRKIRNNLDIDMKSHIQNRQFIEKIIEKPVFIEKKVEIDRSSYNSDLAKQYKEQMIKCQEDFSLMKRQLMNEQELHHQKILECEQWKNHSYQIEDKLRCEINLLKQNFDIERSIFDKELRQNENYIRELKTKINILMAEVENLTHKNIDKNRQIANEIIHSNSIIHINDSYTQVPNYFTTSQNLNNYSQISYIE